MEQEKHQEREDPPLEGNPSEKEAAAAVITEKQQAAVLLSNNSSASSSSKAWEDRIQIVREHYERKGYRVRSGLQFGCELVLYAGELGSVHSDFCIHVVPEDGYLDWRQMQSLVRSMPALRKTLILANLVPAPEKKGSEQDEQKDNSSTGAIKYQVQELALASEHAPFRLKNRASTVLPTRVGEQRKRQKTSSGHQKSSSSSSVAAAAQTPTS